MRGFNPKPENYLTGQQLGKNVSRTDFGLDTETYNKHPVLRCLMNLPCQNSDFAIDPVRVRSVGLRIFIFRAVRDLHVGR